MTGNDHFRYAEQSLQNIAGATLSTAEAIAFAQVHATLALVWAVNRMQTDAHGLQQYMADLIVERAEVLPCT